MRITKICAGNIPNTLEVYLDGDMTVGYIFNLNQVNPSNLLQHLKERLNPATVNYKGKLSFVAFVF